jgi:hypothetical protein
MNCKRLLNIKLPNLDRDNDKEVLIAGIYLKLIIKIVLPSWDKSTNHVFHLFVIRTKTAKNCRVFAPKRN